MIEVRIEPSSTPSLGVITPNDGVEEGSILTSITINISNSEPEGMTVSVTSSDAYHNDSTLTCTANATDEDPEDAILSYEYDWSTGDSGPELVLTGSMMPGTELTCTATATDSSGASISISETATLMNRAPTVDSISLQRDGVHGGGSIHQSGCFTDRNGGS